MLNTYPSQPMRGSGERVATAPVEQDDEARREGGVLGCDTSIAQGEELQLVAASRARLLCQARRLRMVAEFGRMVLRQR